ncbi:hypothetical protein MAR_028605 [Mya arenaria]|uniref:Uncharacterized protein n=1 Tax=Mya arenaria TaxID=6604 RepID=A0ABY7DLN6_MYAAR|nr:hypothetical protein MAR_028605 [Mya arenaria]
MRPNYQSSLMFRVCPLPLVLRYLNASVTQLPGPVIHCQFTTLQMPCVYLKDDEEVISRFTLPHNFLAIFKLYGLQGICHSATYMNQAPTYLDCCSPRKPVDKGKLTETAALSDCCHMTSALTAPRRDRLAIGCGGVIDASSSQPQRYNEKSREQEPPRYNEKSKGQEPPRYNEKSREQEPLRYNDKSREQEPLRYNEKSREQEPLRYNESYNSQPKRKCDSGKYNKALHHQTTMKIAVIPASFRKMEKTTSYGIDSFERNCNSPRAKFTIVFEGEDNQDITEDQKSEWAGFKFTGALRPGKVVS